MFSFIHRVVLVVCILFHLQLRGQIVELTIKTELPVAKESDSIAVFKENKLKGIKDYHTGEILLPAEYVEVDKRASDYFLVSKDYHHYGVYKAKERKMILPEEYKEVEIDYKNDGYTTKNDSLLVMIVTKGGLTGLLDYQARMILPIEYTALSTHHTYVLLTKEKKRGIYFFDPSHSPIKVEYDDIGEEWPFGFFRAVKDKKYFLFSKSGQLITDNNISIKTYRSPWDRRIELLLIGNAKKKWGIYDMKKGQFIIPTTYELIINNYRFEFIVKQNGKFGVVNTKNEMVIPFHYDTLAFLAPKAGQVRLIASKKKKNALMDNNGKVLSAFEYDEIESINGFYKVRTSNGYSVIDSLGNRITKENFDHVGTFSRDTCAVFRGDKYGYMNNKGTIITPVENISKGHGYTTLEKLFTALVDALKADNDSTLRRFCEAALPDEQTEELMNRMHYSYRHYPASSTGKFTREQLLNEYFKNVLRFRESLKRNNELASLQFYGLEGKGITWDRWEQVLVTQTRGLLRSSRSDHEYQIGELIYLDGYWKSFTLPKD